MREMLAARGIRRGYRDLLACAQTFEQRKQRLALVVLSLEHPAYHTAETVGDNPYFQGPFYADRA